MSDKRELSGWLAPNGDFTPVFWGGHDETLGIFTYDWKWVKKYN